MSNHLSEQLLPKSYLQGLCESRLEDDRLLQQLWNQLALR